MIYSVRDGSDSARDVIGQWASGLGAASTEFVREWTKRVETHYLSALWIFIAVAGIGGAGLILLTVSRWPHGRSIDRPTAKTQQQIVQMYRKLLELSVRRGMRITPSMTATDVARLVSERWAEAESTVARLTTLYSRGRFGVHSLSGEELMQALEDIATLKRLARTSR